MSACPLTKQLLAAEELPVTHKAWWHLQAGSVDSWEVDQTLSYSVWSSAEGEGGGIQVLRSVGHNANRATEGTTQSWRLWSLCVSKQEGFCSWSWTDSFYSTWKTRQFSNLSATVNDNYYNKTRSCPAYLSMYRLRVQCTTGFLSHCYLLFTQLWKVRVGKKEKDLVSLNNV